MNLHSAICFMGTFLLARLPVVVADNTLQEKERIVSTIQSTTTLLNFKGETFSREEAQFFDETFVRAWETVHFHEDHIVTKVKIEEEKSRAANEFDGNGTRHRTLRGHNGQIPQPQQRNELHQQNEQSQQAQEPPILERQMHEKEEKKALDLLLLVDWYCTDQCDQDSWFRSRHRNLRQRRDLTKTNQQHRKFEMLLCQMLQSGPQANFQDVEGCTVEVSGR